MVVLLAEFRRHAALPLDAVLERDRGQMTFEIIAPAVIDAGDFLAVPVVRQAQQVAAMGAAVDEGVDRAVRAARDDDRNLADRRRDPVAGIGDLAGEAQIIPGRPLKDALLLDPVLLGIGIKAERDLADPVRRPRDGTIKPDILHGHGRPSSPRRTAWANSRPSLCARAPPASRPGPRPGPDYAGIASSSPICSSRGCGCGNSSSS